MKKIISFSAASLALISFSFTGCAKAKAARVASVRFKTIAVETVPRPEAVTAEIVPEAIVAAEVEAAPAAPAKRVKNPNVPGWQQLSPDMTKEEVEDFIGRPNAKTETKWVYKSGGAIRFSDKGLLASYEVPRK